MAKDCVGIVGLWFGHDFQPRYDESEEAITNIFRFNCMETSKSEAAIFLAVTIDCSLTTMGNILNL